MTDIFTLIKQQQARKALGLPPVSQLQQRTVAQKAAVAPPTLSKILSKMAPYYKPAPIPKVYVPQGVLKAEQKFIPPVVAAPPIPKALEQAKYAWQWGPPYTFPGNPPVAYDTSLKYPIQPEALSFLQTVPVQFDYSGHAPYSGTYFGGNPGSIVLASDDPSVAMHEYLHAWDLGRTDMPTASPGTWGAWLGQPSTGLALRRNLNPDLMQAGNIAFSGYGEDYHATAPTEWYAQWPTQYPMSRTPESIRPLYSNILDYSNVPSSTSYQTDPRAMRVAAEANARMDVLRAMLGLSLPRIGGPERSWR